MDNCVLLPAILWTKSTRDRHASCEADAQIQILDSEDSGPQGAILAPLLTLCLLAHLLTCFGQGLLFKRLEAR